MNGTIFFFHTFHKYWLDTHTILVYLLKIDTRKKPPLSGKGKIKLLMLLYHAVYDIVYRHYCM